MTDTVDRRRIAAAKAYESLHVPALFQQWCERVLNAVRIEPGHRVLDVACGTGVLGRHARSRVGPDGSVAGVDPDAGMLAVAEKLEPTIEWRLGTAESIPFPNESFDVVVSQFGLMFSTDRSRALREILRVLVPGGSLSIAVWDSLENSEPYDIEVELLDRMAGRAAANALRAPFVLGDTRELTKLFKAAGVTSVGIITWHGTARFPSIRSMVESDLRGWLPIMGVTLEEERIDRILQEAESALQRYVTAEGDVVFDSPGHIITGTKPRSG